MVAADRPEALARMMPPLRVRTLGGFTVWRGDEAIAAACWARHSVATLFKVLLGAPNQRLHREQLVEELWPAAEPAVGLRRLRDTLHRLRRVLDVPGQPQSYLQTPGELVALAPAGTGEPPADWLDAAAFAEAATAALATENLAAARAALALYGGDYLPEERYATWAEGRRAELRRLHGALVRHAARLSAVAGELAVAERELGAVLAADPCDEEAALLLMQVLRNAGRRAEALRVYAALTEALREEHIRSRLSTWLGGWVTFPAADGGQQGGAAAAADAARHAGLEPRLAA